MYAKGSSVIAIALALSACAPRVDKIAGTYTPAALYENMPCEQIARESWEVSNRAHTAARLENRHRVEDDIAVTAGLVVFWPALFFTHGSGGNAAVLAQLKGEMEALETTSRSKGCGIVYNRV